VLPGALVATVLARDPETPFDELELKARVHHLIRRLEAAGARVYVPRSDQDYAVTVGLRMLVLRRIVRMDGGLYRVNPAERRILAYYAGSIAHFLTPASVPV
jgi:glycerol-3-phosphate O-acyltransferase